MTIDFDAEGAKHMAMIKEWHDSEMTKIIAAIERCERKGITVTAEDIKANMECAGLRLAAVNGKVVA